MTTEKYYISNEDFILYDPNMPPSILEKQQGQDFIITEQMVGYPALDLSNGDLKQTADDPYAVFRQEINDKFIFMDIGIEICLDHSDARLRRNLSTFTTNGMGGIHVQIIPSCGMQIKPDNVAADNNGFVFNCDGQYALTTENTSGLKCVFKNYIYACDTNYAAHTQLARVAQKAKGDNPKVPDSVATFQDVSAIVPQVFDVSGDVSSYFAGGPGQIHIYGLDNALQLYP